MRGQRRRFAISGKPILVKEASPFAGSNPATSTLWADSVTVTRKSPKLSFKVQILIGLCAEKLWLMLQSAHGKLCSGGCDSLSPLV